MAAQTEIRAQTNWTEGPRGQFTIVKPLGDGACAVSTYGVPNAGITTTAELRKLRRTIIRGVNK